MSYFILYLIFALWVGFDGWKRKNKFIGWGIGTLVLGPIIMPVYYAKRNLRDNETREGGTAWNVLKNFALLWTITMVVAAAAGIANASKHVSSSASNAEQVGSAIGATLGLAFIGFLWFVPMVCALVLGLFLKKSSIVEKGPTGKLLEIDQAITM